MHKVLYIACIIVSLAIAKKSSYIIGRTLYSHPYNSTVHIEPSKINLNLQNNNKLGVCFGWWYFAIYKNRINQQSTIYCLATPKTISRLQDEFYFNTNNRY